MVMQHLTYLSLASNKLEAAPLELQALTSLRDLDLSHNLIYDLPSTMHSLSRLRSLWLQRNRVHVLPPVLTLLTRLTVLDITGNDIIYDATAARVAMLPRLRKINFPSPCEAFAWNSKRVCSGSDACACRLVRSFLNRAILGGWPGCWYPRPMMQC